MTRPVWRIEDPESNPSPPGVVQGSWVSLHYLKSAVRREWRLVVATATAGLLVALAALVLLPQSSTASATLLLAHDPSADPLTAIATDEGLLGTRTVSQNVVDSLGLPMSADHFQGTFTNTQVSTQVLEIDLKAPTAQEAVSRLSALCTQFLSFRNSQLQVQANAVVDADRSQIADLHKQVDSLSAQYDAALASGHGQVATNLLGQKSQLLQQIGTLQQTVQQTELQADSLATASHVVDPAAPVPAKPVKRLVLGLMSGLILGGAVGLGLVFLRALISNNLRRREEVATALGVPVSYSAGSVRGWLPWRRSRRRRNLQVLVSGLLTALTDERGQGESLALVGVGDLRSAATVLVAAARQLQGSGLNVFLVDLTEAGWLRRARGAPTEVYRPGSRTNDRSAGPMMLVASAERGLPEEDPRREEWDRADLVLVLGEAELGVGTGHLSSWTDRVVLLVGAGRATAELLRSVSRMVTDDGRDVEFAMLVGADRTDESLGIPRRVAPTEQRRRAR